MAKTITRIFQGLFGSTDLGNSRVSQFGTLKGGSPAFASSASQIQTSEFTGGWLEAVIGQNYPALEDRNALDYLLFYQLCYLFQQGIPEYDATTTYYQGSFVSSAGVLYSCINDSGGAGISGQSPSFAGSTYWQPFQQPGPNLILNGGFDYWQRTTAVSVVYNATSTFVYCPDRWAGRNMIGTGYTLGLSRQTASLTGSGYAFQASILGVGSGGSGGAEVFHLLDTTETLSLFGKSASFAAHIAPIGNVNQVSLQFYGSTSATNAAQNLVAIGSPVAVNVTTYGQICQILNQAIPSSGYNYIGVRIWVSGVSTGNLYDVGNGFQIEQAVLNQGAFPAPFSRAFSSEALEIAALFRFYERSDLATGNPGVVWNGGTSSGQAVTAWAPFKTLKRMIPGASGADASTVTSVSGTGTWGTTSVVASYPAGLVVQVSSSPTTSTDYGVSAFTADAEIY